MHWFLLLQMQQPRGPCHLSLEGCSLLSSTELATRATPHTLQAAAPRGAVGTEDRASPPLLWSPVSVNMTLTAFALWSDLSSQPVVGL